VNNLSNILRILYYENPHKDQHTVLTFKI